ncbi:hypothetical protein CHISP_0644 [Chitinispirillum alkaliphilum]|nr:hypothetical protein CHISP_0644 [Chitinispirillum alkaliphilum]
MSKCGESRGIISRIIDSIGTKKVKPCPKCGSTIVELYDPFFFSPLRTVKGKRRLICRSCRFIWRTSRKKSSAFERFKQGM